MILLGHYKDDNEDFIIASYFGIILLDHYKDGNEDFITPSYFGIIGGDNEIFVVIHEKN